MKWNVDWHTAFVPSVSPFEIFIRGTAMYLGLFAMLRVILKRQMGTFAMTDVLLIVLLADAAQNGMSADYKSVPDGLLLVATLIFWNYALDWLSFRFKPLHHLVMPAPLPLVENGKPNRRNMRQELITLEELMTHLREEGIERLEDVKSACMEGDGEISVIRRDGGETKTPEKKGGT